MSPRPSFKFWQQWLVYANLIFAIFGLLVAFAGDSLLFYFHNEQSKILFFQGQALEGDILLFKKWLFGIIGGTMVGFHLLAYYIAKYPFAQKEKWAYNSLLYALILWFLVDSGISMYYGAYHNVYLVNLVALFGIGLPLWMTRNEF
jgi:hypothetical protein